jgi:uncharacterized surface protein with fasciclin (FAS1) repeats
LNEVLDDPTWPGTLFAPTNAAFEALPDLPALQASDEWLRNILKFHILPKQKLFSYELPCEAGENLVKMSNNEQVRSICKDGL